MKPNKGAPKDVKDILFKGDEDNGRNRCWFFNNLICLHCGKKANEGKLLTPICKRQK